MDSDFTRGSSASDGDFGFAFNDSNFSDRLLRIEIMGGSAENRADGEGCTSIIDWARHP
ncbi:POZ/BTB domain-containing G-protein 1 [Populus alba x Populus x berolinensis]|nr:POZ/BTB domain-containing G-protein 1 [Populus alba x Populus x berolinensis]